MSTAEQDDSGLYGKGLLALRRSRRKTAASRWCSGLAALVMLAWMVPRMPLSVEASSMGPAAAALPAVAAVLLAAALVLARRARHDLQAASRKLRDGAAIRRRMVEVTPTGPQEGWRGRAATGRPAAPQQVE